jgi:hypothetical protein
MTYNTAHKEFWWSILFKSVHLEDRKVDGKLHVLTIKMMQINQVEIDVEGGRWREFVQDCAL